jgi:hypothetical protein
MKEKKKKEEDEEIKKEQIELKVKYLGCFVLLSNLEKDINEAYNVYRKRNVVEHAFKNYKSHLGLDRLYVQGHKRMVNKSFILFIALILYSYIYKIMLEKDMLKKYTIEEMIIELSKIKSFISDNNKYIRSITKSQKVILTNFDIQIPDHIV